MWQRGKELIGEVLGADSPSGRVLITIPNYLTLLRIISVPLFWYCFLSNQWSLEFAATLLFAFGAITDLWDGKIARRLGQETAFGDFMDPLADKLLVLSGYWALLVRENFHGYWAFLLVLVSIITLREIGITLLRMWAINGGSSVITSAWGKWKTAVQLVTLLVAMVAYNIRDYKVVTKSLPSVHDIVASEYFSDLLSLLFVLSALTSVVSGMLYFRHSSFRRMQD